MWLTVAPPDEVVLEDLASEARVVAEHVERERLGTRVDEANASSTLATESTGRIGPKISSGHHRRVGRHVAEHGRRDVAIGLVEPRRR